MKNFFPPQDKNVTYYQLNRGDDSGTMWASMNLDLQSNLGTMRVSPRMKINASATDDADLGLPVAFKYFGGEYYAICNAKLFKTSESGLASPNSAFAESTETGALTNYTTNSDLELFDDRLWSISSNTLASLNSAGGTWTSRDTVGGVGEQPLVAFSNVPGGRLYYRGATSEIWSIDAANTPTEPGTDYAIDLGDYIPTCMRATSDSIWIGVDANTGGTDLDQGLVLQWDGISPQLTNIFEVKSAGKIQAMVILNDVPHVMDSNGILSKFTGYTFEEVGRLPFTFIAPGTSFLRKNCLVATKNNTILALAYNTSLPVQNSGTAYYYENAPSGVWEWSEQFGFVHKYSLGYTTRTSSTITDFGQNQIVSAGALLDATPYLNGAASSNGSLLVGATVYTNASSTLAGIWFDDMNNTLQKKGYFVTSWYSSEEIQDKWDRLWTTYRRFLASTDSIVMKYRLDEEDPTYATITWVNTTSFTTTTNISAYVPTATGFVNGIGGEVEVLQGTGSGTCVHITNVSESGGTYTVTVDTAVTGVTTGTAKARFQKWIKLNPAVAQDQVKSYSQYAIGGSNTRIQFKGCMTFTGDDEFHKMAIVSNPDISIAP